MELYHQVRIAFFLKNKINKQPLIKQTLSKVKGLPCTISVWRCLESWSSYIKSECQLPCLICPWALLELMNGWFKGCEVARTWNMDSLICLRFVGVDNKCPMPQWPYKTTAFFGSPYAFCPYIFLFQLEVWWEDMPSFFKYVAYECFFWIKNFSSLFCTIFHQPDS
jgi:hypothetical protein